MLNRRNDWSIAYDDGDEIELAEDSSKANIIASLINTILVMSVFVLTI